MFAGWVASGDCALPRVCLDIGCCFGCFRVCLVWGLVGFGLVPGCCSCGLVCLPEFSYWLWVGVIPVYAVVLGFGGFCGSSF